MTIPVGQSQAPTSRAKGSKHTRQRTRQHTASLHSIMRPAISPGHITIKSDWTYRPGMDGGKAAPLHLATASRAPAIFVRNLDACPGHYCEPLPFGRAYIECKSPFHELRLFFARISNSPAVSCVIMRFKHLLHGSSRTSRRDSQRREERKRSISGPIGEIADVEPDTLSSPRVLSWVASRPASYASDSTGSIAERPTSIPIALDLGPYAASPTDSDPDSQTYEDSLVNGMSALAMGAARPPMRHTKSEPPVLAPDSGMKARRSKTSKKKGHAFKTSQPSRSKEPRLERGRRKSMSTISERGTNSEAASVAPSERPSIAASDSTVFEDIDLSIDIPPPDWESKQRVERARLPTIPHSPIEYPPIPRPMSVSSIALVSRVEYSDFFGNGQGKRR